MIITADTITSKQRSKLRSLASNLQPVTQIGKGGVTDNLLKTLSDALEAHELIKVTILSTADETRATLRKTLRNSWRRFPWRSSVGKRFFIAVLRAKILRISNYERLLFPLRLKKGKLLYK